VVGKGGPFLLTINYADGIIFNPTNTITGNGAVAIGNITTENGVIHLISRFLPNPSPNPTAATSNTPLTVNTLEKINTDANLTFLKAAIVRANVSVEGANPGDRFDFAALLSDPNQSYTVFAPNNAAFIAAGYPTLASVSTASPKVLANLLKYHITKYRQNSINFVANSSIPSLYQIPNETSGVLDATLIKINTRTNTAYTVWGEGDVAAGNVVTKDIITTNGLINIIDQMLKSRGI
jgi:hypothetical protein